MPAPFPPLFRPFAAPFPYLPAPSGLYIFQDCALLLLCSPAPVLSAFPCVACLSPCSVVVTCTSPVFFIWLASRVPHVFSPRVPSLSSHAPLQFFFNLARFPGVACPSPYSVVVTCASSAFLIWLGSQVCPPSCPSTPLTLLTLSRLSTPLTPLTLHHAPHAPTPLHPPPSIPSTPLHGALSTHPDGLAEIMVKSLHCLAPSVLRPFAFSPYIAFLRLFVRRISSFVGTIP